jgi:prevent-host-death family protein
MSTSVSLETAKHNLEGLLEKLHLGETVTLVNSEGTPVAVLISLKSTPNKPQLVSDWMAEWDALAQKISRAWKSDKSAVEILTEMRR